MSFTICCGVSKKLKFARSILKCSTVSFVNQNRNSSSLQGRNFLTLKDFSGDEIKDFLSTAADLKYKVLNENQTFDLLKAKSIALIFEKKSTRTRISMETAMSTLGGHPLFLSPTDTHLGEGESVVDTARVLSKLVNAIFGRVYEHSMLETIAKEASVPVINGLSEIYHPLQSLADFLTLYEHYGSVDGLTMSWVGDGNNIIHSLMMAAPKLGVHLKIATPKGYEVFPQVRKDADELAKEHGTSIEYTTDPMYACQDSNVIVTDTWVSMGQEEEYNRRVNDFKGYQVTKKMCSVASEDWCFLHCLPRKPHEVDDEVFYSDRSLVWNEAGNRKWTAMAILAKLLSNYQADERRLIK